MRRLCIFLILCLALALPARALSGISDAESTTVVSGNGTCEVTVTMTLRLEEPYENLTFPLPRNARDVTINGHSAGSATSGDTRDVDLSEIAMGTGTYTMTLHYSLPDAVAENEKGKLFFTLPLLSGFRLPVENFRFSVTLPGEPENMPTFQSVIDPAMDADMIVAVDENTIRGRFPARIADQESLTMVLEVSTALFPQSIVKNWSLDTVDVLMIFAALLAIVYWLIALRCRWSRKVRCTVPPEGITAGDVACRLTGQGVDLTLMVLSWAQMGYIFIQLDDNGRVLLHKRMDMGNERSDFENRYFRSIFGKRRMADATGFHYARLCRKAAVTVTGRNQTYGKALGARRVFRVLAALIGGLAGVSLAIAFARDTVWRVLLGMVLGILGLIVAWNIQRAAGCLHRRGKLPLVIGLAAAVLWVLLSAWAGELNVALFVVPAQYIAGLAYYYGGRRTALGRQTGAELLGLRRHLRKGGKEEFRRLLKSNPQYFYDMASFAMALDADRTLARQLGNAKLPQCPYLSGGMDGHMTAKEFDALLRETVSAMDALQLRLPFDRLRGR